MTNNGNPRQLSVIVGERLKQFRDEKDLRQADIAEAAQRVGLAWARSSVAAIEAGTRNLSLAEFFKLPWLIVQAGGWDKPFLPPHTQVQLESSTTTISGMYMGLLMLQEPMGGFGEPAPERIQKALREESGESQKIQQPEEGELDPVDVIWRIVAARAYGLDFDVIDKQSSHDMEMIAKVSARLEMPDGQHHDWQPVVVFSWGLWGHTIGAERDLRAAGGEYSTRRSLQSARGHVTRELISELSEEANRKWPLVDEIINQVWPIKDDSEKLTRYYLKEIRAVKESAANSASEDAV